MAVCALPPACASAEFSGLQHKSPWLHLFAGLILEDSYHLEMQVFCSNRQRSDVKSNSETIQIIMQDVVNMKDKL